MNTASPSSPTERRTFLTLASITTTASSLSPLKPYRFHHPGDQLRARSAFALRRREAAQARADEAPDLGSVRGEGVPREIEAERRLFFAQALRFFPPRRGDE